MTLPPYVSREEVQRRLLLIFPDGTANRAYCTREIAASTVFTMLYIGAVDGTGHFAGPKHVVRMSDDQEALTSDASRIEYATAMGKPGAVPRGKAWYADNTREPIRDETLRQGLIPTGAVIDRKDLPTTSSTPRYALTQSFAALFDPNLVDSQLMENIAKWRDQHLTAEARARVALVALTKNTQSFLVTFPNGETRTMSPGPSSIISKQVIESFAPRFLKQPGVLWLSESGNKVVARDDILAKRIKLDIDPSRNLPDIILIDRLDSGIIIVFVEVVATDGPISEPRRADLLKLATDAGFSEEHVAFVTAFLERNVQALRKSLASLAWNSFVWIASEPEKLIALFDGSAEPTPLLRHLLREMKS
jgi:hypothetical protein